MGKLKFRCSKQKFFFTMAATEVLSIVLSTSSDLLDDASLNSLLKVCKRVSREGDLNGCFRDRCDERRFMNRLHEYAGDSVLGQVNWMALFCLNMNSRGSTILNVHCGEFLFSVPQKGSDVVFGTIETLSLVLSFPFDLYHMSSDGRLGSLCRLGETGSRFVVVKREKCVEISKKIKSLVRSSSMEVFQISKACVVPRGRALLRSTAHVLPRCLPVMFRSYSAPPFRETVFPERIYDYFFTDFETDFPTKSTLFRFETLTFNFPLLSVLPQSVPKIKSSEIGLFSMFNDLLDAQDQPLAMFQRLASRLADITLWPSPRVFDPFNVNRIHAVAQLSAVLTGDQLANFLEIADKQFVSDRPLLARLARSDWAQFRGLTYNLACQLIGPTCLSGPPLPGPEGSGRLISDFTDPKLSTKSWTVKINFIEFDSPIFFNNDSSDDTPVSPSVLSLRNCLDGFKLMPNGVMVTSWKGLLTSSATLSVSLDRSGGDLPLIVSECLQPLARHGIRIKFGNKLLLNFWCSGESVDVSVLSSGRFSIVRSSNDSANLVGQTLMMNESTDELLLSPKTHRSWSPGLGAPVLPNSPISKKSGKIFKKKLKCSNDTRQFEFHPFDDSKILLGSRSGVVSLIDSERDFPLTQIRVDYSPILALSWLRAHANLALYGGSSSGLVGMVKLDDQQRLVHQPIARFGNLSSVTVNCTDDYFAVSGFARNVSIFDLFTGQQISELEEVHSNFINIVRFSNYNPQVFATSSFDCTCKLWDLRSGLVATHTSPSLNVMCSFSPQDEHLLVSGLDGAVTQLSVGQNLQPTIPRAALSQSVPSRNSNTNYRRSVYLADGRRFITAGTDENFVRVVNSSDGSAADVVAFENGACYVQSLRGHPTYQDAFGVLMYPLDKAEPSFVCLNVLS